MSKGTKGSCPCGGFSVLPSWFKDGQVCGKCRRMLTFWNGGDFSWSKHPADVQGDRLYSAALNHFSDIHRDLASLKRSVKQIKKDLKQKNSTPWKYPFKIFDE